MVRHIGLDLQRSSAVALPPPLPQTVRLLGLLLRPPPIRVYLDDEAALRLQRLQNLHVGVGGAAAHGFYSVCAAAAEALAGFCRGAVAHDLA